MGRADEIGIGLVRQRRVGDVAAVAAKEDIVLDADVLRLVVLGGGVHALFRNSREGWCSADFWRPLYNRNRQSANVPSSPRQTASERLSGDGIPLMLWRYFAGRRDLDS